MAYDDTLGVVLDRLGRPDLEFLATGPLRDSREAVAPLSERDLRLRCSEQLRRAGGHSARNLFRGKHDLPYDVIVRDVATMLKAGPEPDDDVLMLERRVLQKWTLLAWDSMSESERADVLGDVQAAISKQSGIKSALDITDVRSVIAGLFKAGSKTSALTTVSVAGASAGPLVTTVGSVMGWNALQAIIFKTILSRLGVVAAAKAALGIGAGGAAMAVAAWAGPIAWAASAGWAAHKIADVAYRKTGPGVVFVALKRLELFA